MPAKKTNNDFINDMKYYYGNDFIPIIEYTGNNKKMIFKHNCGHEFEVSQAVKAFSGGLTCPVCGKDKFTTVNDINKKLNERYNQEYKLMTEFKKSDNINNSTKINILHLKCNTIIETTVGDFFNKCKVCKKCKTNRNKFTVNDFEKYLKENTNGEYIISKNNKLQPKCVDDKITITHTICNRDYDVSIAKFKSGRRCPLCLNDSKRLSENDVFDKLTSLNDSNEYIFSLNESYRTVQSKIHVIHKSCNNEYDMRFADIVYHNQRCPFCKASVSENKVASSLDNLNISYIRQYKTPDCKDKRELPFDFKVILDENTYFFIEFNGIQHYFPCEYFDGDNKDIAFELRCKHDKIKSDYCKENNIPLLIIPYTQINSLDIIIENFIKELKNSPVYE